MSTKKNQEQLSMTKPSIEDLTKGEMNRYELTAVTYKTAKIINDQYIEKRTVIEENEKNNIKSDAINANLKDRKPVRNAIEMIHEGKVIIEKPEV